MASIAAKPSPKPTNGERTIGIRTFSTITAQCTTPPEANNAAPTSPPNSACDEDDGSPKYQVMRFQAIAPTTPANTTPRPLTPRGGVIRPSPTVFATPAPR